MSDDILLGLSTETDIYNIEFDTAYINVFELDDLLDRDLQNIQASYYYQLIRHLYSIMRNSQIDLKIEEIEGGGSIKEIIFGLFFIIIFNNIAYAVQKPSVSKHRALSYINNQQRQIETIIKPNIGNVAKFMDEFHSHIPPLNDVKSFVSISNKFISVAESFINTSDVEKTIKLFFERIFFPNVKKTIRNQMYAITCNYILDTIPYEDAAPFVKPVVFVIKKRKEIVKLVDYLKNIQNHIQYVASLLQKILKKIQMDENNIYKIGVIDNFQKNNRKITAGKKRKTMKLQKHTTLSYRTNVKQQSMTTKKIKYGK